MLVAVVILSILLAVSVVGWVWAEMECNAQKSKANRIEQYNNWIETKHALAVARLKSLGAPFE